MKHQLHVSTGVDDSIIFDDIDSDDISAGVDVTKLKWRTATSNGETS